MVEKLETEEFLNAMKRRFSLRKVITSSSKHSIASDTVSSNSTPKIRSILSDVSEISGDQYVAPNTSGIEKILNWRQTTSRCLSHSPSRNELIVNSQ